MSWGASNRNRKHCFLLVCILCLQPRRPTPGCLLGLRSFIKKAKAGLNLLGTSHLQSYSQTWLFGEDSPFSPRKQGSDSIPRLATEDPKWKPNDTLKSGQVLTGRVQCGTGQAALCSVFFTLPQHLADRSRGWRSGRRRPKWDVRPCGEAVIYSKGLCIQTSVSCVFSVHMFCSKVVCSIL